MKKRLLVLFVLVVGLFIIPEAAQACGNDSNHDHGDSVVSTYTGENTSKLYDQEGNEVDLKISKKMARAVICCRTNTVKKWYVLKGEFKSGGVWYGYSQNVLLCVYCGAQWGSQPMNTWRL